MTDPFVKPESANKRLKMLVYGTPGVRKTRFSLTLPNPVCIDMEKGTVLYGEEFDFRVNHETSSDGVLDTVTWLLTNDHKYKTLIIDPISNYWSALQDKWADIFLQRKKTGKGHKIDFYELQVGDWGVIKRDHKKLMRKIFMLDMNVVFIAREKAMYAEGEMMKKIGVMPDCEKNLPYDFDVVLRFYKNDKDVTMVHVEDKDRAGGLPVTDFELSYETFENAFGKDNLDKVAEKVEFATPDQLKELELLRIQLMIEPDKWAKGLTKHGVSQTSDLTKDLADEIIEKLTKQIKEKK